MSSELLRIVENIAYDKNISKESVFVDLEEAMISAAKKHYGDPECEVVVSIDRASGEILAFKDSEPIDIKQLGRIAAQTARQVMTQKIRADERESIYTDYIQKKGELVSGSVARFESGTMVINIGQRIEAFMSKPEQIVGQSAKPGERIQAIIVDVTLNTGQVKIMLSQTHPDFIKRLFEQEVPEIAEGIIEIRALSREAGYRSKVAVFSNDEKVDPVGACVGVRGSRIRNIVDELGGEKIDIVRWNESSQLLIINALMPANVSETALCFELGRATVVVDEDQLSLAIGKHGQNVRLAARLTGWDIDIMTPDSYDKSIEQLSACCIEAGYSDNALVDKLIAIGIISIMDLDEVGTSPLVNELQLAPDMAAKIVETAKALIKQLADEKKAAKAAKAAEAALAKEAATSETADVEEPVTNEDENETAEAVTDETAETAADENITDETEMSKKEEN